MKHLCTVYQEP